MTLLTPPFALGASGQVLPAKQLRHALGSAFRSTGTISAVTGCLYGPPNSMGELTLVSNTQLTVRAFKAIIANTVDITAGPYQVTNDATVTLTPPVQDATQWRRALIVTHVDDSQVSGVASSGTTDRALLEILPGTLAASSGAAALPATPNNALLHGDLLIGPSGQPVTLTAYNPRTTVRGGILPVLADGSTVSGHDGFGGLWEGEPRWHPTKGLQFNVNSQWVGPSGVDVAYGFASAAANAVIQTTAGTTEERMTAAGLNPSIPLTSGRIYRVEALTYINAGTAGTQIRALVRGKVGSGATVASTDKALAQDGLYFAVAGTGGRQVLKPSGRFQVSTTDTYTLAISLVSSVGVASLLADSRGLADLSVTDLGPVSGAASGASIPTLV